ncbi:hypothetical protein [Acinetobacter sp. ACNIH2]|uniref:hypothetical protein n=1 Tax=Acinetobacter sp. ACNIH2 TaxID=1758189 RepID=UPI0013150DA0|nr:hypothetical protein [Acinetobacter sp. ACNIH2]
MIKLHTILKLSALIFLLSACSKADHIMKSSQAICDTKQCPTIAFKINEKTKALSLFIDVENDDSEIEQVDLVLNGQQNVFKLSDENVENSNTGKSTYLVLNVKKDLVDSLVSADNSSISIKTKNGTFTGVIRNGQQDSELYKAAKEFKSNLN